MAFDVIDFDAPDYEVRVRNAAHRLGLDAARHMPFRDTELNHQKAGSETPAEVADLWMQLSEAAR
ncbi:hypothetical protein D3C86_2095750 [compost metagenome]